MRKNKCVFLDRDGVINTERGDYTFMKDDFEVINGVTEALGKLKQSGFHLVVVTNQAGISRGLFSIDQLYECHEYMNIMTNSVVDEVYYSRWHPSVSESLARKPDTLMFERGLAKYDVDPSLSWMVGNAERDLIPARKLDIQTILIGKKDSGIMADYYCSNLFEATKIILNSG
ncbi:D-glycero-alpha-D-manno-heptose-1,7-bisphosphate 7-phosphatase [Bacteroidota bacterium]